MIMPDDSGNVMIHRPTSQRDPSDADKDANKGEVETPCPVKNQSSVVVLDNSDGNKPTPVVLQKKYKSRVVADPDNSKEEDSELE